MKAVILAAGEGKRLRPMTFTRPKVMLPVAGKPILEHVIGEVKAAGIREIVLVVKYMGEKVRGYFGDGKKWGVKINYITQGETYGTGAAFLSAEKYVDDEPFLGIAGDVITEAAAIRRVMKEADGGITVGLKPVENPSRYGVAILKGKKIVGFEEKPEKPKSNLANTSIYAFGEKVMGELRRLRKSSRGEVEVTDAIRELMKKNEVTGVKLSEYWMDIGMPWQFLDASNWLIGKMPEKRKGSVEDSTLKGKVVVEEGAHIFKSYIEGPCYIGRGCDIGPFVYIRPTTSLGSGVVLSSGTTVKNSILMDRVNAKHLTYIGDSIIGEGCNFGAGTQIANYKFDASTVKMMIENKKHDTEKSKFGALIGDETKTGVLACTMPGKSIGDHCWIGAGVVLTQDVPPKTKVFVKQTLEYVDGSH